MTKRIAWLVLTIGLAQWAHAQDVQKLVTITTPVRIRVVSVCGPSGLAAGLARNGSVYVWRLPSGELVSNRKAENAVRALACSPDGKWLAIGKSDGTVAVTDVPGKMTRTLTISTHGIDDLAFSPDGSLLAVNVSGAPAQLWNSTQGTLVATLKTDFSGSTSMDFSPDSALFATADSDTSVRIYDRNGRLRARYSGLLLEPFAISFMPDGKQIAVGGADCTLTILDVSDAHVVRQLPKQSDPIFAIAALPDGTSVLSVHIDAARLDDYTALLWNMRTGEKQKLDIDVAHMVGGGTTANRKEVLFTADSDSALSAWTIPD
jgi:WD40 repeat protein